MLTSQGMSLMLLLVWGCSQNFSEKRVEQALAERGLLPVKPALPAAGQPDGRQSLDGLEVMVPEGWQSVTPNNPIRKAEYLLPGEEGEGDASLAVVHFDPGQGGGVEANIARWYGQFSQPEGPRRWTRVVYGMPVTLVDVSGIYRAAGVEQEPGFGEGYRMLGAVVESQVGSHFIKLVGPERTVARWEDDYYRYIDSLRPE